MEDVHTEQANDATGANDGAGNDVEQQTEGQERDNGEGQQAGARRKRASKLEAAQNKVAKHKKILEAAEKNLHKARNARGYSKTEWKRKADVQVAENHLNCVKNQLGAAEQYLKDVIDKKARKALEKRDKEEQQEQRARDDGRFSEDTLAMIVQCKLMFEKDFNDSKKRNSQVWPDVLKEYERMQASNEVPAEDTLTLEELKRRYQKELEYYRDYCKKVQRMKTSGASRDDIDAITTRKSTEIFNQHDYMYRPMSQTPLSINVLNTHRGGEVSVLVEEERQMQGDQDEAPVEDDAALLDDLGPSASGDDYGCSSASSGPVAKRRRGTVLQSMASCVVRIASAMQRMAEIARQEQQMAMQQQQMQMQQQQLQMQMMQQMMQYLSEKRTRDRDDN